MYLFFCMTLGEFGGIDAYFKSQRQELTYGMLYTEAIFLTTISQKLTQNEGEVLRFYWEYFPFKILHYIAFPWSLILLKD